MGNEKVPLQLGAVNFSHRHPGQIPAIVKQKEDLPTKRQLQDCIPAHCFERSALRSLGLVIRDGLVIASIGYLGWQLPTAGIGVFGYLLWNVYWFAMGTALTGWWVLAHECGHQGFSASKYLNNAVGFVLHSALLVPYFSWQYSHAKHHSKTNHMLDGESHVPPLTRWRKLHAKAHELIGDDAFAVYGVISHLLFGWPAYLFFGATGARRSPEGVRYKSIPDHWRPSSKLYPAHGNWSGRVIASNVGILAALLGIYRLGAAYGFAKVAMMYFPAYLWTNAWLVLYTWMQHTNEDIPHFGDEEWTWMRGALSTIDRPFDKWCFGIFDWMHHHIGSTHVCHHLFSTVPCYHATEATAALRAYLEPAGLYNYDAEPIWRATWRVSQKCHYMNSVEGICTWRSLTQDLKGSKEEKTK